MPVDFAKTADEGGRMSSSQTWDPERYARNARFVSELGAPVVELLAPRPGERILDLGCGDGALTEKLAAIGCDVIGVDGSAAQVAAARARGIDARAANPWYFPTTEDYEGRLRARGFVVRSIALIPRPTPLPGDVTGWLETFAESFTNALPPSQRPILLEEVQASLRPDLCDA